MSRLRWRVLGLLLLGAAAVPDPGRAGEPVSQSYAAAREQVWSVTRAALEGLGWDIDDEDEAGGWIVTDSEAVDFQDFGVYGEGTRHRLRVHVVALDAERTRVSITRELYTEERILWTKKRKSLDSTDTEVERAVLRAVAESIQAPAAPEPIAPRPPVVPTQEPRSPGGGEAVTVTYLVGGSAQRARLTYRNAWGGTERQSVRPPWEVSFDTRAGELLSVSVRNEGETGSVTCEILIDGVSRTRATSRGAHVTADCRHVAAGN